jgi:hypothetical protein
MGHYADDVKFSSPAKCSLKRALPSIHPLTIPNRLITVVGIRAPGLRFEFVDALLGVDGMCIVYKRETGAVVVDVIELDANGKGKVVQAFYGEP